MTSRVASVAAMCASSVHQQVGWVDVHCVWHQAKYCRDAVIVSLSTHHALQLWASIYVYCYHTGTDGLFARHDAK